MPASKRFLHPEAIGRIARLDLRARRIVEGFLAGIHRSPYFGQSVEFLQHREYTPGDELQAHRLESLGQAGPLLRQAIRGRHEPARTLLVDVSGSMRYGSGPLTKYDYGCTVAASLAYLLLRQQDAVGCMAFDAGIRAKVPQRTKRTHLNSIIQALAASEPAAKTEMASILSGAAETYPRRGLMVLISDLLVERPGLDQGPAAAAPARSRGRRVPRDGRRRARFFLQRAHAF